jgi:hypothetical protein
MLSVLEQNNWTGPTCKVWSNTPCKLLEHPSGPPPDNVERCKEACEGRTSCTAFNYNSGGSCELQECSLPVPDPSLELTSYEGYYITEG